MDIRFISSNQYKIREVQEILGKAEVRIHAVNLKIEEIQTEDVKRLVRDKVLKAFSTIGRPVFVEHTGLYIRSLNELPGGLTQIFWDRLQADAFANLVGNLTDASLIARTVIGYCDSREIHYFDGEIAGTVPKTPRGPREFQWDCVFVPDGHSKTFAELGDTKNAVYMRRKALDAFAMFLQQRS